MTRPLSFFRVLVFWLSCHKLVVRTFNGSVRLFDVEDKATRPYPDSRRKDCSRVSDRYDAQGSSTNHDLFTRG